jgi:hypothetical protein
MKDEFRDVIGFVGRYKINKYGDVYSTMSNKTLKPTTHMGYKSYLLRNSGKYTRVRLSRMIYEAFIGPIPEKMMIDHIDRNRSNNSISNLRCVDSYGNQFNRIARRTFFTGTSWAYGTKIFGALYKKAGFDSEEDAFLACEKLRSSFNR